MWLKVLALKLKGEKKNWEGEKLSARASFGFSIQQETKKKINFLKIKMYENVMNC